MQINNIEYNIIMKVKSLDLNNKIFITEDNEEYPILFDIDDFITLDKFQELLNKSSNIIEKLININ